MLGAKKESHQHLIEVRDGLSIKMNIDLLSDRTQPVYNLYIAFVCKIVITSEVVKFSFTKAINGKRLNKRVSYLENLL